MAGATRPLSKTAGTFLRTPESASVLWTANEDRVDFGWDLNPLVGVLPQIHCYRADDMLSMMQVADAFGWKVRSFHHALEAYKIAPELAASGVAAVVWSDWGAFKLEAYDATVYNARILIEAGEELLEMDAEDVRTTHVCGILARLDRHPL